MTHFLFFFALILTAYGVDNVPRISTEQLNNTIDDLGLVLLDVRTKKDWEKSDRKIVGAIRVDPDDVESWAGIYSKNKKIVLYCA